MAGSTVRRRSGRSIPTSEKGVANGVATLGADSKVPPAQIPSLAIGETFTVASQAAMLALAAQRGDVAIRTDLDPDGVFWLAADDPTVLANWIRIGAVDLAADAAAGVPSLRTLGFGATQAAPGDQAGRVLVEFWPAPGTYTWNKPSWAKSVRWGLHAAGCGGASGRKGAAGTARVCGGPGAAGGYTEGLIKASDLEASGTLVVGAGGAGGAAVTADSTDGNNGTAGGPTTLQTTGGVILLRAGIGGVGVRGQQGAGGTGGVAGSGMINGGAGGTGSTSGGAGGAAPTTNMASGGGAGGGITTANVANAGGAAGFVGQRGAAGAAAGGVGANGADATLPVANSGLAGTGGGGGGASTTGNAGRGGHGIAGGGGGGGGAAVDGVGNSGAGGNGGDGWAFAVWMGNGA